ncbi:GH92 family glycosyl hydrolase [Pendulispora albinea]|uniref:GH92 family glycosyl hydrolase n=1 Tax=Pendulispora albinea TaxID=2741071 RepID=A0ABZ2M320_9BACT
MTDNVVTDEGAAFRRKTEFFSSLEAKDPQPTWTNTVETGPGGAKKALGITGPKPTGIPGNVTDQVVAVTASKEHTSAGEIADNLSDGDVRSKWLAFESTGWVAYKLAAPVAIVRYALASANDAPERDPKDWTFQGSHDGDTWVDLDRRTDQSFGGRFETRQFEFTNTTAYLHYRLKITANHSGNIVQLAELQISNGDNVPPPTDEMRSATGRGPTSSYNAKTRVGFTGVRGLEYGGTHTGSGRVYSYNKVFDVDVVVTPHTELSYLIFPSFVEGDLTYASTYAAVDLAFSDGTYLSQLGALDQHAAVLSPRAQGESKTLYTNDWNYKVSKIGEVAAGKRIKRILVAYDNPNGAPNTAFGGYIDDITLAGHPASPRHRRPSDWVLTTRGTNSSGGFSRGNNFPATAVPHGFNFWTPVTNAGSNSWLYSYHRSNNADNLPALQALSLSHEPSPWMGDRQSFQVMPSTASGAPDADRNARKLPFRHENEVARAHYYGVTFENGLRAEIAPTDHAAMFRFTFTGDDANLIFDNINDSGGLTLDAGSGTVSGYSDHRSGLSTGATRMFVYATFDRPVIASGKLPGGGGANVTGYFRFGVEEGNRTVTMRIATSLISLEQAKQNLLQEIGPNDTFDAIKERARRLWDAKLGVVEVDDASPDQLTTLYSNLYRLFLYPNSGYEKTGKGSKGGYQYASPVAAPPNVDPPAGAPPTVVDGKVYVNNGFWDTYRSTWAAYALLTPSDAGEMIDGFVEQYRQGGWIARWSSPGYADLMTGTSSDVAFADAYLRGVTNFDAKAAYDAALRNATVATPDRHVGRKGNERSIFLGYTPTSTDAGLSWAMAGYLNDFGIANMAKALSRDPGDPRHQEYVENAEYFLSRAQNYVNLFDPSIGFFQGRSASGAWRVPKESYDPREWGHDYTETNGWNTTFDPAYDGQGLANLYGGRDKLASKLDAFFATPETATFPGSYGGTIHEMLEARDVRMGQLGLSNQPSFHIPYMYVYTGQPWKTQEKVREAMARLFVGSNIGQGYLGDEDNGATSSWGIFSALGFYPLQVGSPTYVIGSPLFTRATVQLENGRRIVIRARKNGPQNVYVQSLRVNGVPYTKTYLPHALLAKGAVLDFEMGPRPSSWGTGEADVPPSITRGDEVARPLHDVSSACTGGTSADGGDATDVARLFDDSSATAPVVFASATPWVQCKTAGGERVRFYSLTSSKDAAGGDPTDWVLEGSSDGTAWTPLDPRTAQTFAWRSQTRAFKVPDTGATYTYYRIRITRSTAATTALGEVELLAN